MFNLSYNLKKWCFTAIVVLFIISRPLAGVASTVAFTCDKDSCDLDLKRVLRVLKNERSSFLKPTTKIIGNLVSEEGCDEANSSDYLAHCSATMILENEAKSKQIFLVSISLHTQKKILDLLIFSQEANDCFISLMKEKIDPKKAVDICNDKVANTLATFGIIKPIKTEADKQDHLGALQPIKVSAEIVFE